MNGLNSSSAIFFGKTALVQFQLRTDHDDGTAGVVHALAEQVLAEAALLALQRVGERLQRAVVGAAQHAAAAAVVEQRVDRFLQHALFVAHDDFRRMQVHQLLQPVVAVDDAAIEIVQIGGRKAAAIEWNQGAQLRRNHRQHVQDHPLRLVAALAECFHHFQPLGVLRAASAARSRSSSSRAVRRIALDVHALEKFFDRFRAHHGFEAGGPELLVEFAELGFVLDDLALLDRRVARIDHNVGLEVENAIPGRAGKYPAGGRCGWAVP